MLTFKETDSSYSKPKKSSVLWEIGNESFDGLQVLQYLLAAPDDYNVASVNPFVSTPS